MNELVFACLLRGPVCEKAVFPLLSIIFFSTSSFRFLFSCFPFSSFLLFEGVRGEVGGHLIIHQVPYGIHFDFGHLSLHY